MQTKTPSAPISFVRLPQVKARTGLSRATIYVRMAAGKFPAAVNLGGRAVAWIDTEITQWMASRVATRPGVRSDPPEQSQRPPVTSPRKSRKSAVGSEPERAA